MFCKTCLFPNTKPDINFNEDGICDSCISAKRKHGLFKSINWSSRKEKFEKILDKAKLISGNYYNCIVPVSGGKDSTWQVYVMKKLHKMNPLAITFDQFDQTPLGRQNLEALKSIGVDHIHFTMNPDLIRKLVQTGFEIVGDPYWVNHVGILTVPIHFACKFKIPLVVYGENPLFEYGGPEFDRDNYVMNKKWRQQHGGMRGMREEDVVDENISIEDIRMLTFPEDEEIEKNNIQALFYGHFFKWQPDKHTEFIKKFGWKEDRKPQKGSWSKTENLDMKFIDIRESIKFLKYGYGRATDQLNIAIKSNLISRKKALKLADKIDGKVDQKNITHFCKYLKISKEKYNEIMDSFVNHNLFVKDNKGEWRKKFKRN